MSEHNNTKLIDESLDSNFKSDSNMDHSITEMISIIMNMRELIECMREVNNS